MWLRILEGSFGFLLLLGVITQIIWPLLVDAPLFPLLKRQLKQPAKSPHQPIASSDDVIEGEIIEQQNHPSGDR